MISTSLNRLNNTHYNSTAHLSPRKRNSLIPGRYFYTTSFFIKIYFRFYLLILSLRQFSEFVWQQKRKQNKRDKRIGRIVWRLRGKIKRKNRYMFSTNNILNLLKQQAFPGNFASWRKYISERICQKEHICCIVKERRLYSGNHRMHLLYLIICGGFA